MNTERKKLPLFWGVYLAVTVSVIALILIGAALLTSYLAAFEESQPIHGAEKIFRQYFESKNFEAALKDSGFAVGETETLSDAAEALSALTEGKVMSFYAVSSEEGEANYNVVVIDSEKISSQTGSGEEVKDATAEMAVQGIPSTKIATLRFEKSEKKGSFGFRGYEFSEMEIFLEGKNEAKVCIPSGYSLFVNGKELGEGYIKSSSDHEWNEYLPEGTEGITLSDYEITGLYAEPSLTCTDEEGEEIALARNEETGVWEAALRYEDNVDAALSQRILTGMEEYAKYMQDDGSIGTVSTYFDRTSMFYKNTASNPSSFVWDHNGYEFRNEVIDEFYFFDENTLCCHVSFDQVLKMYGKEDYVDHLDMTVFVRKVGSSWRIYDRIVR